MKRSILSCCGLGCLAALAWSAPAHAQPASDDAPVAAPRPAPSRPRFYFRIGGVLVEPLSTSNELELSNVDGPASLALHNGPIAGSGAKVDSAITPAAIVGYVLPTASRRWSVEGVLGLPFTVKFQSTGTLANQSLAPTALGIPTGVGPLGPELGEATALPVVLTAVYSPFRGPFQPYVGAGPSVLIATKAHVTNPTLTAVRAPEMSIAPAPGLVLQGGLDVRLWRSVYARLDVKFIALMVARAEVDHIVVETPGLPLFGNVEVGTAKMNVTVNPLIVQLGVGWDFDLW